jgi:hypothetical protein
VSLASGSSIWSELMVRGRSHKFWGTQPVPKIGTRTCCKLSTHSPTHNCVQRKTSFVRDLSKPTNPWRRSDRSPTTSTATSAGPP